MLDQEIVELLRPQIETEGISLAKFVRNLMEEKANLGQKRRDKRNKKLLSVVGILDSSKLYPEGFDHNDIYKI
jgi:hypothetical protein